MKTGAFVIPTGIGASIGGFAGDACKWARKFASKNRLIVNPNVVNAACFSGITENMLYLEGYSLDEFFKGHLHLLPSKNNRIGVIFDKQIPKDVLDVHINTINAVKTVYDIDIPEYIITEEEVGVDFFIDNSGSSVGNIKKPETLLNAGRALLKTGVNVLAVVCFFPEDQGEDYENGIGVDPVGGVEAIISHYISKELKVPCAHAPAFADYSISPKLVDPRCAAEFITPTFLPCILLGLQHAPKLTPHQTQGSITIENVDFLITPYNCLGGIPMLEMSKRNKKVYAIRENETVLNVSKVNFPINCDIINTYEELLELI